MTGQDEALLLVQEYESFAMIGSRILDAKTAPQFMVVARVTGRLNRTQIIRTYSIAMSPDDAITWAEAVIHSARVAKGDDE